ncbi:MAG: hypothetical protein ACYC5O_13940 [Anaerolineae bacterium]
MATDIDRVRKLLPHWMEHNAEHADEFREWAEKVRALGASTAADGIVRAAQAMERANDELRAALGELSNE